MSGTFKWDPRTFEEAKKHVDMARGRVGLAGNQLASIMPVAIDQKERMTGDPSLTCPSPKSDPLGKYRVGLTSGREVEIQKYDSATEAWVTAPDVADNHPISEIAAELEPLLFRADVADEVRSIIQLAVDKLKAWAPKT